MLEESTKSFCNELAEFLTAYLINMFGTKRLADKAELAFCFEDIREKTLIYNGNTGKMKVTIIKKNTVMGVFSFWVEWKNTKGQTPVKITDVVVHGDVEFNVDLSEHEKANLKYVFSELLHLPVVNKNDSDLHFDYQIKGGTEEAVFRIQFCDKIADASEVCEKVKGYFAKPDENGIIIEPGRFEAKKTSPKSMKIEIDLGSMDCQKNIIEDFLSYLDKNFDNIKKVIVE